MNSSERVMAALTHQEGDRVPLFLMFSHYGAKECKMSIPEYFSRPAYVVEAQIRMRNKYRTDSVSAFQYASCETEAFGGTTVFCEECPPNAGPPVIRSPDEIADMQIPIIDECEKLQQILTVISTLKLEVGNEVPIIGVAISPFSLPVMQMGFENYLELIYFHPKEFQNLMRVNEEFCIRWANSQLNAGATAICYFNPLSSPTIIEKSKYLTTGYIVDKRTLPGIKGPIAFHLASGISFPVIEEIIAAGSAAVGISSADDLVQIKNAARNKICLIGNMNAVEMVHWNDETLLSEVKNIIGKAGKGGGLILSDNHGDIPWQVPEDVLRKIGDAVQECGQYPLK